MNTSINDRGSIPLSQPYNTPPWNYTGDESVISIPNADVVDWLLLELRETEGDVINSNIGNYYWTKSCFSIKRWFYLLILMVLVYQNSK